MRGCLGQISYVISKLIFTPFVVYFFILLFFISYCCIIYGKRLQTVHRPKHRPVPSMPLDRVAIQRSRTSRSTLFFFLGPSRGLGPPGLLGQLFFSPTAQAVGWEKYLQLQTDESCIRFLLQQRHFVAATAVIFCYDQRVFLLHPFFAIDFLPK